MEGWNRKVLNTRRYQIKEPTLDDMTDFIEQEAILMSDPLFSPKALADYHTKLDPPVRQEQMKNYKIKAEDEDNKKDVKGSSEDNSSRCKICDGQHKQDQCKAFNDMTVEERSKFLSKQKLRYVCYESISPNTARNCPRRRNCKICLAKHSTGLHGYKIRRKDDSKSDGDPGKTVKSNCANSKDVYCESIRVGEVLSMCVVSRSNTRILTNM